MTENIKRLGWKYIDQIEEVIEYYYSRDLDSTELLKLIKDIINRSEGEIK